MDKQSVELEMSNIPSIVPEVCAKNAVEFLHKYKWLHDFKLTRFYADRIHEQLPDEWSTAFSELPEDEFQQEMDSMIYSGDSIQSPLYGKLPKSLTGFMAETRKLSLARNLLQYKAMLSPDDIDWMGFNMDSNENECDIANRLRYGMSVKKFHEVSRLATFVGNLCRRHGVTAVVDLGSGMGYLDCVLSENFDLTVLAIESDAVRTNAAENRAKKWSKKSSGSIYHRTLKISHEINCHDALHDILAECGISRCCIVGLHCCGDFTPAFLDIFASLAECQSLVCVGCCYHLMELQHGSGHFRNCPMSTTIREKVEEICGNKELLTTASLRLATQETKIRWLHEIDTYAYGHSFRAILECAAEKEGFAIRKSRRHTSVLEFGSSVELFIEHVFQNYHIIGCTDQTAFGNVMRRTYENLKHLYPKLRFFRVLQGLVQGVLESFIVIDRYLHLRDDLKLDFVQICPLFDEEVSPRNLALVAVKQNSVFSVLLVSGSSQEKVCSRNRIFSTCLYCRSMHKITQKRAPKIKYSINAAREIHRSPRYARYNNTISFVHPLVVRDDVPSIFMSKNTFLSLKPFE